MYRRVSKGGRNRFIAFLLISILFHLILIGLSFHLPLMEMKGVKLKERLLLELTPMDEEKVEGVEKRDTEGQIVDLPPPLEPEEPKEARFLAEQPRRVEKETTTPFFKVNPLVVSEIPSVKSSLEYEDLLDLKVEKPSTGATAGFREIPTGRWAFFPEITSNYSLINKEGLNDPVPASHTNQELSGAPQNDLIMDVPRGDGNFLNSKEFLFASYINRIRALINFYFSQTMMNSRPERPLQKIEYSIALKVVLDSGGNYLSSSVALSSGIKAFDNALIDAFRLAAPFSNPPAGIISGDGYIYLPVFIYNFRISFGEPVFTGIDPRANVQFPGALKAPR